MDSPSSLQHRNVPPRNETHNVAGISFTIPIIYEQEAMDWPSCLPHRNVPPRNDSHNVDGDGFTIPIIYKQVAMDWPSCLPHRNVPPRNNTHNVDGDSFTVPIIYVEPSNVRSTARLGFQPESYARTFVDFRIGDQVEIRKFLYPFTNLASAKQILREIELLRQMDHENVIALRDIILPRTDTFEDMYIVYECLVIDLYDILMFRYTSSDSVSIKFMYQLLCGLNHIHSANVIHCNLNPNTVMINREFQLKIRDFGLALTPSEVSQHQFRASSIGVAAYQPPELICDCKEFTSAIDVWSVGCIFLELLTKEILFPTGGSYSHFNNINKLIGSPDDSDIWFMESEGLKHFVTQLRRFRKEPLRKKYPTLNTGALDLIEKMLVYDPRKRITTEQALRHPCFASVRDVRKELDCDVRGLDSENLRLNLDEIIELVAEHASYYNHME